MRILLVEDDPLVAAVVAEILEYAGQIVMFARAGSAALALFHDGHPRADLLILEAALPDMPGWDVLACCRAIIPGLPCVILTDDPVRDFRVQNYVVTLEKPFTEDALLAAIRAAVTGSTA